MIPKRVPLEQGQTKNNSKESPEHKQNPASTTCNRFVFLRSYIPAWDAPHGLDQRIPREVEDLQRPKLPEDRRQLLHPQELWSKPWGDFWWEEPWKNAPKKQ